MAQFARDMLLLPCELARNCKYVLVQTSTLLQLALSLLSFVQGI